MSQFLIKARYAGAIRWNSRGSCSQSGCKDPECCCSLCGEPIGVPEEDPRWDSHSEYCDGCALCLDQIPAMIFRGQGKKTEQAQFHHACFEKIVFFKSQAGKP